MTTPPPPVGPTAGQHSVAVYPGTFDPITNGHIDYPRAQRSRLFDQVIVTRSRSKSQRKQPLFTAEERIAVHPRLRVAGLRRRASSSSHSMA